VSDRSVRTVLWLHTVLMGLAGSAFYLVPAQSATLWPWSLPPLAARFLGSLFLGGAVCSLVLLYSSDKRASFVMVLLAAGDALIALSGLLGVGEIGLGASMICFLALFGAAAALLAFSFASATTESAGVPVARALRLFFLIHLLVVLPVGVAMFFLPAWAQPLWPWRMAPINVRLIGSFFLGAAFISAWALRQRSAQSLQPTLALYAVFATLATIASVMHFGLFDPARRATWAFFALYIFVAGGSWLFFWRTRSKR
jgi:hypothetical protein